MTQAQTEAAKRWMLSQKNLEPCADTRMRCGLDIDNEVSCAKLHSETLDGEGLANLCRPIHGQDN